MAKGQSIIDGLLLSDYKFDFGQHLDEDYLKKSYAKRPLAKINAYRKEHKVREFNLNYWRFENG